jgi:hypothetical protein
MHDIDLLTYVVHGIAVVVGLLRHGQRRGGSMNALDDPERSVGTLMLTIKLDPASQSAGTCVDVL